MASAGSGTFVAHPLCSSVHTRCTCSLSPLLSPTGQWNGDGKRHGLGVVSGTYLSTAPPPPLSLSLLPSPATRRLSVIAVRDPPEWLRRFAGTQGCRARAAARSCTSTALFPMKTHSEPPPSPSHTHATRPALAHLLFLFLPPSPIPRTVELCRCN
jgi:hypothetical protein